MKLQHNKIRNQQSSISLVMLSLFCLMVSVGFGQPTGTGATGKTETSVASPSAPGILVTSDEDYRIGINDVIEIQIEDASELSNSYRITKSGTFLMPFLGRITAINKTPEELSKFIADGLRDRYLNNPNVKVVVRQYNSRSFFIQGAVRSPGVFQVEGKPSLLVLLTLAGGLAENHSSSAFILRPNKPTATPNEKENAGGSNDKQAEKKPPAEGQSAESQTEAAQNEYSLLKVNINGLLLGRFEQNMYLQPGDIVNVPESEIFFVAGEIQKPGSFVMREGTTLRHALSLAQGPNFKSDMKHGIIFREDPGTGKKKEITVDFDAVMKGKKEDVPIMPNDIVYIPNSKLKTATAPLLQAFGMNAVMRMPVF